jgi:hypothetical protein
MVGLARTMGATLVAIGLVAVLVGDHVEYRLGSHAPGRDR